MKRNLQVLVELIQGGWRFTAIDYGVWVEGPSLDFAEKAFLEVMEAHPLEDRVVIDPDPDLEGLYSKARYLECKCQTDELPFFMDTRITF